MVCYAPHHIVIRVTFASFALMSAAVTMPAFVGSAAAAAFGPASSETSMAGGGGKAVSALSAQPQLIRARVQTLKTNRSLVRTLQHIVVLGL